MMNAVFSSTTLARRLMTVAMICLAVAWTHEARAQWSTKWLSVGRLHHPYFSGGAEPENLADQWNWPGIRPGTANNHWKGLWVSVKNYTDENGKTWPVRTSHIGPRILGIGEMFDISHELVARFEAPVVTVDGFETFNRPLFVDRVDPNLKPDRMVESVINTSVGITIEKRAMQWSNIYHDSYHLIEYVFTNTGNVDDDEEIEVTGQTLEDVYFMFLDRPKINAPSGSWDNSSGGMAWGQHTMNDAVGDGLNDYGVDFRAQFSWLGYVPGKGDSYSTLGNPMWFNHQWNSVQDDTLGRLGGAHFVGTVTVHADAEAHAPGEAMADDPAQPRTMTYVESDWSDITTGNDHTNEAKMSFERDWIERGSQGNPIQVAPPGSNPRTYPTHAYMVEPDGDFVNGTSDPSLGRAGGWGYANGYGPYTMAPGEQVRIVVAEGVYGLSDEAAYHIGRTYKLSGADDNLKIGWNAARNEPCPVDQDGVDGCVAMTKNEWVMTARDSLFMLFERAIANHESGLNAPHPPLPPSRFAVTSGTNQILLEWDTFAGGEPSHGWEIWRAQKAYHGIITALRVENGIAVPDSSRAYELIAELPPSARSYTDTEVERGLSYFYYIQAVGDVNNDPTANTPTGTRLKSSRYYTQTYEPAFLRRPPGQQLEDVVIVPNPYSLSQDTDVRFGDQQDKLAFYGLPAEATIRIYTELGELVDTIEHTDGSGDEFWDLTTSSRQVIVSGLYLAVIEDNATGETITRKFIVVR